MSGGLDMERKATRLHTDDYKGVREVIDLHLPIRIKRLVRRDFELAQFWRWHRSILRWRIVLIGPRRPARTRQRGQGPFTLIVVTRRNRSRSAA